MYRIYNTINKSIRNLCLSALAMMLFTSVTIAQTTLTTGPFPPYTGTNSLGAGGQISFVIQNTNPFPMLLTGIGNYLTTADNNSVWRLFYTATELSNSTTNCESGNWNLIATSSPTPAIASGIAPINFVGLSFTIPASTEYRFALENQGPGSVRYSGTGSPLSPDNNIFSGAGVNLKVGTQQIAGFNVGYSGSGTGLTLTPRYFTGSVTVEPALPCTAPPVAGVTTASANPVCPSQMLYLSLTGGTGGLGQTYQWQSSPDGITWTNIPGATSATYSTNLAASTYFRAMATCSAQTDSSAPLQVMVTPFYNCYCASNATSTADEYIDTVRIGSFVNQSFGVCTGYQNFTTLTPVPAFFKTQSYPSVISTRDCENSGFYSRYVEVYIDFNQDGVYADPAELVMGGPASALTQSSVLGNITIPPGALTGVTGMRVVCRESGSASTVTPCGTYTWGETEDYLVDIRPLPNDDAGIATIVSPSVSPSLSCSVEDTIKVLLTTIGVNDLTSADIVVNVNNTTVMTYNWTGLLTSNQTTQVDLGYFNFNDGDIVKIWTENPNGNPDEYDGNDTITRQVYDAMSGIYTVYGTIPDFATLNDAIDAIELRGICGDVTLNVRPGTYTEQVEIATFPEVGAGNYRLTIQSETQNATDVTFDFMPFSTANNFVVGFNGADRVTLNEITLQNMAFFSTVVSLKNGSEDIIIENCVLMGDTMAAAVDANKHTINSVDGNDNNLIIRNNQIFGGSRAIWLFGQSNVLMESGLEIYNNTISQYYQAGIVLVNQIRPEIRNNQVMSSASNGIGNIFHIDLEQVMDGTVVTGNHVGGIQGGFGINLVNIDANPSNPSLVANNMVYMGTNIDPTYSECIALQDVSNTQVVFNSLYSSSTSTSSGALRLFNGSSNGIDIINNNIMNAGAGLAILSESAFYISNSNHNNLFVAGTDVVALGTTTYATLADWQNATGFDAASLSLNPNFNGSDLHTCRTELDGAATPIAGVSVDFDGDPRHASTPDIGADEFVSVAGFTLGPDLIKCPSDSVLIAAPVIAGSTYNWSPFFQNTPSITALVPATYFVQVISNCGLAIDTVIVTDFPNPSGSFTSSVSFYSAAFTNTSTNATSYFWDFGDSNTSTEMNPVHIYANEGIYTVTLTVTNDCGTTTVTQTVEIDVQFNGIESESEELLTVYPNPTDEFSRISFTFDGTEIVYVSVMDLAGKVIWMRNMGVHQAYFVADVDFSSYAAGTYLVRVVAGKHNAITRIVVK